ncbi:urea carboxylase [Paenibacillus sp. FSL H7-0326]|uniref:urea amidolyase associated protein UAAP1 n=1 Tax=Paenibacillus sp. FSL H7-0326 TaxID=1921144 RepID=UPI00096CC76B|nr:urea amidolyase associated protein UAAP1 [Paenibacillus sp. FSL H7-0326]OMC67400.1 urea carboxylase [Paenibacillus sp. FSL H7-0326]
MTALFSITVEPGGKWSAYVGRGKSITFTAQSDRANLSALLFHAPYPSERYNMPDTLKAQHTAFLTQGHVLMSDQGRVLASITEDSVGWHDPLSGYTTKQMTDDKYGVTSYQKNRNQRLRNGEENLIVEMYSHHLSPRDLSSPINFFSKVICELDGTMKYVSQSTAGRSVTLRTEMDVLLVLSNTPNPLDPTTKYPASSVQVDVADAAPVTETDPCVTLCDENRRAFENTWNAYALMKGANE